MVAKEAVSRTGYVPGNQFNFSEWLACNKILKHKCPEVSDLWGKK